MLSRTIRLNAESGFLCSTNTPQTTQPANPPEISNKAASSRQSGSAADSATVDVLKSGELDRSTPAAPKPRTAPRVLVPASICPLCARESFLLRISPGVHREEPEIPASQALYSSKKMSYKSFALAEDNVNQM